MKVTNAEWSSNCTLANYFMAYMYVSHFILAYSFGYFGEIFWRITRPYAH